MSRKDHLKLELEIQDKHSFLKQTLIYFNVSATISALKLLNNVKELLDSQGTDSGLLQKISTPPPPLHGRHSKSCNKCSVSLTGIPRISTKFCEFWQEFQENHLQNSGIPQDSESVGFRILYKLLLPFLEILKFLGTQLSVVHGGDGGLDIFWNSPI